MKNPRKERNFWESKYLNDSAYIHWYDMLTNLAISMFEWKGLPDSVDPRFLELALFADGMAIFFKDEDLSDDYNGQFFALQTMIGGRLDVYRVPDERSAYATNGYNRRLDSKDSVIIFNNMTRTNCLADIEYFARKLYEVDRTIDVNVKGQKTPLAIVCDENQRLVMKNLYAQYDGNEPFIFGSKNLDLKGIQAINTGAPFVADKLQMLKTQIWNEALTFLGISNVSTDKKERLVSDEVTINTGATAAQRYTRLNMRKQACEKINQMFGLNVSVEYREDLPLMEEAGVGEVEEGGEADE